MEILKHLHRNQIIRFSLKAIRRKTGLLSGDDKPTIIILPEKGSGCLIIINKVPQYHLQRQSVLNRKRTIDELSDKEWSGITWARVYNQMSVLSVDHLWTYWEPMTKQFLSILRGYLFKKIPLISYSIQISQYTYFK